MALSKDDNASRVLHGVWLSPYMALVAQVLEEAGLGYQYQRISPFLGHTRAQAHLARNSLGKIPSLIDEGGVQISESLAICRYLARTYPQVQPLYPCSDPIACAEVDRLSDFLTFSISGPFFNWFVVGAYWPQAWGANTEKESEIFSQWSMVMIRMNLNRLLDSASLSPYLLGDQPTLPDFHLFHVLQLGKTFSSFFDMPALDLALGDERLQAFHAAVAARPATATILKAQDGERERTRQEIFETFRTASQDLLVPGNQVLEALFGHPV